MAKRVVQECDLTKQEYDPAETVTLIIKKGGKKTGRTYELSQKAAEKLEQQLVSGNKLDSDWTFKALEKDPTPLKSDGAKTLADLDDDSTFVAEKKQQMQEEGIDMEPRVLEEDQQTILPLNTGDRSCLHMNKGRVQTTLKNGKRHFYRICRECRGHISENKVEDREEYLNAKPPADVRVGNKKD